MPYFLISESNTEHACLQARALRRNGSIANVIQGLQPTLELLEGGCYDFLILQGQLPGGKPVELLNQLRLRPVFDTLRGVVGFSNEPAFFNGCDIPVIRKDPYIVDLMNDRHTEYLNALIAVWNNQPVPAHSRARA